MNKSNTHETQDSGEADPDEIRPEKPGGFSVYLVCCRYHEDY
jgi:hypothetical protein